MSAKIQKKYSVNAAGELHINVNDNTIKSSKSILLFSNWQFSPYNGTRVSLLVVKQELLYLICFVKSSRTLRRIKDFEYLIVFFTHCWKNFINDVLDILHIVWWFNINTNLINLFHSYKLIQLTQIVIYVLIQVETIFLRTPKKTYFVRERAFVLLYIRHILGKAIEIVLEI